MGYFIGDAPHVGSIHATVNRIWTGHKAGTKIDVQFIAKNTVLFRIENDQMRNRVIQRKYWHIADIPLVVNVWSPESAQNPPDLSAMPLWVDLRGVPNTLYSNKGLKCLVRAVGNFVKLHPNTEKCVRLDMARILVEVDLHKTLVEKITFADQAGASHEVLVNYPWLPPRCNVCCKWGHKGQDCSSKEIKILSKRTWETTYTSMPREGIAVGGGKGKEVEGSNVKGLNDDKISGGEETGIVEAVETRQKEGNPMEHLIKDLEELSPVASLDEKEAIKISETTKELSKTIDVWVNGKGVKASTDGNGEKEFMISPSRFSPLQDIDEEEETCLEGSGTEVEEGEFRGNIVDGKKEKDVQVASKNMQQGSVPRQLRGRVTGSKLMSNGGKHGSSKKTSGRKL